MNMNKLIIEQVNDYENKSDYLMNKGKKERIYVRDVYFSKCELLVGWVKNMMIY